jgi:hypothetical protein
MISNKPYFLNSLLSVDLKLLGVFMIEPDLFIYFLT